MVTMPARLLTGFLAIQYPLDTNQDPEHPAFGAANKWAASIDVIPQQLGIPREDWSYAYGVNDVKEGDWVASTEDGKALKVVEIVSVNGSVVDVVLEDVDSYNAMIDTSYAMDGSIVQGQCIIFELSELGLPILGPIPYGMLVDTAQDNLFARFNKVSDYNFGGTGSGSEFLLEPTRGAYADGAFEGWTPGVTKQADAFDQLNILLKKMLPDRPPNLQDQEIFFTNQSTVVEGTFLADGEITNFVPDLPNPSYFDPIIAVDNTAVSIEPIVGVGDGDSGILDLLLNRENRGQAILTPEDDSGVYGDVRVLDDYYYPIDGNLTVWRAIDISAATTAENGINELTLTHSGTGTTSKLFVVETLFEPPEISDNTYQVVDPVITYVSGVPHFTVGTAMKFSMTGFKLVGRTFVGDNIMGIRTDPDVGSGNIGPLTPGMPSPITVDMPFIPMADVPFTLDAENIAAASTVSFYARNSFYTTDVDDGTVLLYAHGSGPFLVDNSEQYKRVRIDSEDDRPEIPEINWEDDWDSGSDDDLGDLQVYDAPIIGGVALPFTLNMTDGYLPVGPDFSVKPLIQYFTVKLQTITNRLKLEITGQFTNLYIALPGITNEMPNSVNGWWDATKQADFAPTLWPGHFSASDGCLISQTEDGVYEFSFGSVSSAASVDNMILLRFVLTSNDRIQNIRVL